MFTANEVEYIQSQQLGRLATVDAAGQPHVVPIGYEFDGEQFVFSGLRLKSTAKFRHIQRFPEVALVIDDVEPPWKPRGIEIKGRAEIIELNRDDQEQTYVRIVPTWKRSWGIEKPVEFPR